MEHKQKKEGTEKQIK